MTKENNYIEDIKELKDEAIVDLEAMLVFAKELLSIAKFNHYIKAKTVIRYNTFSAMYQRADAVLALTKVNQGNAANIIIRSMWETLAEYDFINLETTNLNLDIRLASESKQLKSTWTDIKRLRTQYPISETWKETISDVSITNAISRRETELSRFAQDHPEINLDSYKSLISRLKIIDDMNLSKNPEYKNLTQFDYRTVYSLLSSDTHSTVLGNLDNSRMKPKESLEVRLDAPIYESVRSAHVAYKLLLKFLQNFNRNQKLKKGIQLRQFRSVDNSHDKKYQELQQKYGF